MITIGILAVQGAFAEHGTMLKKLDVNSFEIRKQTDLNHHFDGLIIPGGESTVIGSLLTDLDMLATLKDAIHNGLPVFGTCAGLILLAKEIEGGEKTHLATMDIDVVRNGYGRQLGSFNTVSRFLDQEIEMTFIRAPYIKAVGDDVKILATVDGKIVAAQQQNQLVTAFHPELTDDTSVHRYFINLIKNKIAKTNLINLSGSENAVNF